MLPCFFGRGAGRVLSLFFACALAGCATRPAALEPKVAGPSAEILAPGVEHRAIATGPESGVDLIDVDLTHAPVTIAVVTDSLRSARGRTFGRSHTPAEWLEKTRALAVVNGGFFGELDADGRTEIMGLLVQNGKVRHAATVPHAVLLLDAQGHPSLTWTSTRAGQRLRASTALGCGPMLVWRGNVHVTDKQERLVSHGARARTFVAADAAGQHFVMGIASAAEYTDVARFIIRYFSEFDRSHAGAALCLDGGSSAQLTYKLSDGTLCSPRMTGASVPDAVAILPR